MAGWDIAETRRLIERRHGREQLGRIRNCLRAVNERLRHVRYHFDEARQLLKSHIDDRVGNDKDIYTITWPTEEEDATALDSCLMKVEANMIAAAQAIHSTADNLAHVVYYALGLNLGLKQLPERDVTIHRIIDVLASDSSTYGSVAQPLRMLIGDASFSRIGAITNVAKHRGFVESQLSIEPAGRDVPYAMEYGAFRYGNDLHPAREIKETLAPAYEAASRAVVDTGIAINELLSR